MFELAAAAAGTGIVATDTCEAPLPSCFLLGQVAHDVGWWPSGPQFRRHDLHRLADVVEERFVARTQVVEARLAIGGVDEAVLGATAVAHEAHLALATVTRQGVPFGQPKSPLFV